MKSWRKLWEFETGDKVWSDPAISSDGTVYIGSDDFKLYALTSSSKGLANSPWPKFGQNNRNTHRVETDPSLVAHFPFNGNAVDHSGNDNNGTVRGADLSTGQGGDANGSYLFDGTNDDIAIGDTGFPMGNSARTVSGWVKLDANATGDNTLLFYGKKTDGKGFWLGGDGAGNLEASGHGDTNASLAFDANGTNLRDGSWHHVAFTLGSDANSTAKLYIDGVLQSTRTGFDIDTQLSASADYQVVISNGAGDLSSNVATVTVLDAPVIAVQPADMNASTGATVAFTVTATGSEPLNYQWQKDGVNIDGATLTTLSLIHI